MKIERIWAMPNKWTFTIKPIRELIKEEMTEGLWCDPFAGENSPAEVTNDLHPDRPTTHHMEALEFISGHGDIQKHYTVQLRKESEHDGVEIIIDRKLNKYFNLGMYLKGESWVKELYIVKK